jgi:hypothetical protein
MTNPERNPLMNTNDTNPETTTSNRARRATALGVTAGVVGGGLVGLLMAVPSITSAANEDTGDTVVAALQESADPTVDTTTDATTDERPDPGTHLREALQPLVDDGTIEAGQADAVAEFLAQNRPERDGPRGPRGP